LGVGKTRGLFATTRLFLFFLQRPWLTYLDHGVCGKCISLPADLRQADISFQRFKQLLKTFLSVAEIAARCD